MSNQLLVVHVHCRVKSDCLVAFKEATIANATASRKEPGIARFDVVQEAEDPTRFALIEVYRSSDAPAAHKETAHYAQWRDTVAEMMSEPRSSKKYFSVDPEPTA